MSEENSDLPDNLRDLDRFLAELSAGLLDGSVSVDDAEQQIRAHPEISNHYSELINRTFQSRNHSLSIGKDGQIGDVTIRDIANGPIIHVTFINYSSLTSPSTPTTADKHREPIPPQVTARATTTATSEGKVGVSVRREYLIAAILAIVLGIVALPLLPWVNDRLSDTIARIYQGQATATASPATTGAALASPPTAPTWRFRIKRADSRSEVVGSGAIITVRPEEGLILSVIDGSDNPVSGSLFTCDWAPIPGSLEGSHSCSNVPYLAPASRGSHRVELEIRGSMGVVTQLSFGVVVEDPRP